MTILDSQFGSLTFDPEIGWWEGRVRIPSGEYALYIHASSDDEHVLTEPIRRVLEKVKSLEEAARSFAADELLLIHNSEWSDEGPIDAHKFISRLTPAAIQVWPDGDAEISYGDGGLFWGHEIGVRFRGGRFTEAVVQG
jgi:hypothetical protein